MDEHPVQPLLPVRPDPDSGWRGWSIRRARRRAEHAHSITMLTAAKRDAAQQRAEDREAGRTQDPLSWPMRIVVALVGATVLGIAGVIALVVIAGQIPFYDLHLSTKNVDLRGIGLSWQPNLPTFTPLATEGLVLGCTLMAIILVVLGLTSRLWTRAMWFFASIAAFVNTWHMVSEMGDLFGGVLRGGLSVANPFLVHLFVLWCRHLRSGKTVEQARVDFELRWNTIGRRLLAVLVSVGQHLRHPTIAVRATGYFLGVQQWNYGMAWNAASLQYRRRVQARLQGEPGAVLAWLRSRSTAPEEATQVANDAAPGSSPVAEPDREPRSDPDTSTAAAGDPVTPPTATGDTAHAFTDTEVNDLIAALTADDLTVASFSDQAQQATDRRDPDATRPRPNDTPQATDATTGSRPRRDRAATGSRDRKRPGRRIGRATDLSSVDITDLEPHIIEVTDDLQERFSRDRLLDGLRARNLSCGGRRAKAAYRFAVAYRKGES